MGDILPGTVRVRARDLKFYEKTARGWKKAPPILETQQAIALFKKHHTLKTLLDKDKTFLKGSISPEGKINGARLTVLPTGQTLDKAYSLFAKHLTFHDQKSHDHWDVIYQNPGGTYAYLYTQEKKDKARTVKYKKVEELEKRYARLYNNTSKALKDSKDRLALPMYTLLKTYMRVGNELYYKTHGHKGLTTLTKSDILINKNLVTFTYLAKDGVPMTITEAFPPEYIQRLHSLITPLKKSDFVFTDAQGLPLKDIHFMQAFERYCGMRFYPHIIRSYYATQQAKSFLKTHKQVTSQQVKELYLSIASKLGHKRHDKKNDTWKENYTVTIHHYLQPEVVGQLEANIKPAAQMRD